MNTWCGACSLQTAHDLFREGLEHFAAEPHPPPRIHPRFGELCSGFEATRECRFLVPVSRDKFNGLPPAFDRLPQTCRVAGTSSDCLFQGGMDLFVFRKFPGCMFRVDLLPVNEDLETPVVVRREREAAQAEFVLIEQLFRQTDGFGLVASGRTVFDADFHSTLRRG
jgi:hypothetical protein